MQPWYKSPLGWVILSCFLVALLALSSLTKASDVVEFPESELSRESVLPVFDQPEAVKKRYVPTQNRIELDQFVGTSLNDAFLYSYSFGGEVQYHLTEIHAAGLLLEGFGNTNTSYVAQIQQQVTGSGVIPFAKNPTPTFAALAEYEFTPYYGKISLAKQTVINLNISATARAGMLSLNPGGSTPAGGIGVNERFFLTRNFGIKLDLSTLIYQKTDVIQVSLGNTTEIELFVNMGVVWLLPML